MHKYLLYFVILSFQLFATGILQAALPIPKPPSTGARSFIIQDYGSGNVLAEENSEVSVEPASITKLMTAYVVFSELQSNNIALSDIVTISMGVISRVACENMSPADLINQADAALYEAKESGRNQYRVAKDQD